MGASIKGHTGFDDNAWFFETANAGQFLAKVSYFIAKPNPNGFYSIFVDIARYFE